MPQDLKHISSNEEEEHQPVVNSREGQEQEDLSFQFHSKKHGVLDHRTGLIKQGQSDVAIYLRASSAYYLAVCSLTHHNERVQEHTYDELLPHRAVTTANKYLDNDYTEKKLQSNERTHRKDGTHTNTNISVDHAKNLHGAFSLPFARLI